MSKKQMTKKKMNYFFYQDKLYRTLYVNRPADYMYAWDFEGRKKVQFLYSFIKKNHERAFTTTEVCEMVNRHRESLSNYIAAGGIHGPSASYSLDGRFVPSRYYWSKKQIYELHDYIMTIHQGRPRKDGEIRPLATPTKAELRAMMDHETIYYVKNDDGKMVKVFKEPEW
jgi:hypothetical protein